MRERDVYFTHPLYIAGLLGVWFSQMGDSPYAAGTTLIRGEELSRWSGVHYASHPVVEEVLQLQQINYYDFEKG